MMLNKSLVYRLLLLAAILTSSSMSRGAEKALPVRQQSREFDILIDGSKSGTNKLLIAQYADGRTVATTDARVSMNYVVYSYTYHYQGKETWRQGQPRLVDGLTEESGEKRVVRAGFRDGQMHVIKEGTPAQPVAEFPLTTNFWYWPEQLDQQSRLVILDVDNGQLPSVKLARVGTEPIVVEGQSIDCTHYRLSGPLTTELWFDASRRLIKQTSIEDGHRVELKLLKIRDSKPAADRPNATTAR